MYDCIRCGEELEVPAYLLNDTVAYCSVCYEEYESIIFSKTGRSYTAPLPADKEDVS